MFYNTSYLDTCPASFEELSSYCRSAVDALKGSISSNFNVSECRAGIVEFWECLDGETSFSDAVITLASISYEKFLDINLEAAMNEL
jgi:hypothetical protein